MNDVFNLSQCLANSSSILCQYLIRWLGGAWQPKGKLSLKRMENSKFWTFGAINGFDRICRTPFGWKETTSPGCRFSVAVIPTGSGRKLAGWRSCGGGTGGSGRRSFGFVADDLVHEGNVSDGQSEGLDSRQPLLVGEGWHFASQLVKRFVQVEHAASLPNVGRSTLRHRRHPFPFLGRRRRRWRPAIPHRIVSVFRSNSKKGSIELDPVGKKQQTTNVGVWSYWLKVLVAKSSFCFFFLFLLLLRN